MKKLLILLISILATVQAEAKTYVVKRDIVKATNETESLYNKYVSAESPYMFAMIPQATEEWCSQTNYIPHKYIALYKNLLQGVKIDEDFTKDSKNMKQNLVKDYIKDSYKQGLEGLYQEKGFKDKKDLCVALDTYRDYILLSSLREYKANSPKNYDKYFSSIKLDSLLK